MCLPLHNFLAGPAQPFEPFLGEDPSSTALVGNEWRRGAPGCPYGLGRSARGAWALLTAPVPRLGPPGRSRIISLFSGGLESLFLAVLSLTCD